MDGDSRVRYRQPMPRWRSPEELAEIGLSRSRVLMVNEAHDGLNRCVRTRDIGVRLIEPAHAAGGRHLAMEALTPDFAAAANRGRCLEAGSGYLAQADQRRLMTAALEHGWSLIAYEAEVGAGNREDAAALNDRQEQQARNLAAAFGSLSANAKLMVWCGWSHHFKRPIRSADGKLELMGSRFQRLAKSTPFCIDQCLTIRSDVPKYGEPLFVRCHRPTLEQFGGTAGYLVGLASGRVAWTEGLRRGVDAVVCSLHNQLE